MVMRKHQRYFPIYEASGEALLPHFITVANGQIDVPTVRAGMAHSNLSTASPCSSCYKPWSCLFPCAPPWVVSCQINDACSSYAPSFSALFCPPSAGRTGYTSSSTSPNIAARCLYGVSCADGFNSGAGNEAVLRARFEDAQFFYAADLKQPLEAFLPKLAGTQFHADLGNLLQKSERVTSLIRPLAELTGLTGASFPSLACRSVLDI